ncbi:MAG TPA: DUF2585 family protein [Pirellulales bacterium]|jgi:hypothetical protein
MLFTPKTIGIILALLVAFVAALHFEGRMLWGKAGIGLWSEAWTNTTSQNLLDPYSLSHFLHGVIFFWFLRGVAPRAPLHGRLVAAVALEMAWELLENSPMIIERYRQGTASLDYSGDTILNSLGDTLSMTLGFCFASRFNWKASVAIFIAFELLGLYLARDNLTLNVIMLIRPLDAIKNWQLAR